MSDDEGLVRGLVGRSIACGCTHTCTDFCSPDGLAGVHGLVIACVRESISVRTCTSGIMSENAFLHVDVHLNTHASMMV